MTKVCFQALPISAFMKLQMRVFPIYFKLQTGLLLLTAITYPHYGPISLLSSKNDMVTLSVAGLLALSNMLVYGPATERAMVDRNLWSKFGHQWRLTPFFQVTDITKAAEKNQTRCPRPLLRKK